MSVDPLVEIGALAGDLVVQAGAGTGKTHALVTLYLHLATGLGARDAPLSPARLLVITFTEKAAGELRERIRARLGGLLDRGLAAEPLLAQAAARSGRQAPPPALLRGALAELGRAPIGTFHGFGHALLRRHARALGLDPAFGLLDEVEAQAAALEAVRQVVVGALAAADPAVEALVDALGFYPHGRAGVVEAVARVRAALAEEGRPAAGIADAYAADRLADDHRAALAALRSALADLGGIEDRVGEKSRARVARLREAAPARELDGDGAAALLAALRDELKSIRASRGEDEAVAQARERTRGAIDALAEALAARRVAPMAAALARLIDVAEARYAAWKRAHAVVDFADLIVLPRDALRDRPALARAEGERFAVLLVDEFQDTNRAQAELVAHLAAAATNGGDGRRFIVGDRKQSIYEFRGADVAAFAEAAAAMRAAGAGEVLLRRSFRSAPRVVALCNALFARAFGEGDGPAWALRFEPARDALVADRPDDARAGAELLRVAAPEGASGVERRRAEARAIAARMRALLADGRRPRDLALLLRRYTHLGVYLEALRRAGLPHYVVRGRGFYEAQEVRDVAALIALLHDPDDRLALTAVLRSPLCGLSDPGLARLAGADRLGAVALRAPDEAPLDGADRAALAELAERVAHLRRFMDRLGPGGLLREALEVFDLRAIWAATPDGDQKIANLEHLVARADELAGDPIGSAADLPGFARWIERAVCPQSALDASGAQIVDERDDVVRVMSVHQAKGLEFPVVFVADCGARENERHAPVAYDATLGLALKAPGEEGQPGFVHTTPSRRVRDLRSARQRAESLRLFYVAATRARDRVVFSGERGDSDGGWRAHLDAVLADPRTASLLEVTEDPLAAAPPAVDAGVPREVDVAALPAFAAPTPVAARRLRVAVTQLQDFALCARRYHLFHELRLEEHPRAAHAEPPFADGADDPLAGVPADPLRAGTLAHRLLQRCTFGLDPDPARAELRALLGEEGYARGAPAVAEVEAHVLGFLATRFARGLTGRPVRRELPFALGLPSTAGARVLRGQIDLLVFSAEGIDVLDYKHARRGDLDAYRFQLDAYALAARALYPAAPRVRVGLSFLREADPSPVWLEVDPADRTAARLGALADALAGARLERARPGVERPRCEAIGCGYLGLCHGEARG